MKDEEPRHTYPGVSRLNFFLAKLGMMAAVILTVVNLGPENSITRLVLLAVMVAGFVLDVMRLRNTGVSQWFAMLRFVPYAGTLLDIYLQSAQTGWIESKRFDRAGVIILAVYAVFVAVVMYFVLRGLGTLFLLS